MVQPLNGLLIMDHSLNVSWHLTQPYLSNGNPLIIPLLEGPVSKRKWTQKLIKDKHWNEARIGSMHKETHFH